VVVVARIAVDGAAHCQSLTVCKTLSSGQAQFGHEVEIGGQFAAGVADRTDFVVLASRRTVGDKYLRIVNASGDKALAEEVYHYEKQGQPDNAALKAIGKKLGLDHDKKK